MTEKERFDLLMNEKIDQNVLYYLQFLFKYLNIEICGRYKGTLIELMKKGRLEGWCWQTTESAVLFMPDDSIIYRGDLYFSDYKKYYHSFIVFTLNAKDYVFDPCLGLINTAPLYFETFDVDVKGSVTAKEVKDYFVNYINNPPKRDSYVSPETEAAVTRFMKSMFGDDYYEKKEKNPEVVIHDKEDPNAPMYRNGSGYKDITFKDNEIKKLTVHYYMNA